MQRTAFRIGLLDVVLVIGILSILISNGVLASGRNSIDFGSAIMSHSVFSATSFEMDGLRVFVGVANATSGAQLFVFEPIKQVVTAIKNLDGARGAWAITSDEQYVYIGTYLPAQLYRYDVTQDHLDILEKFPEAQYVWDVKKEGEQLIVGIGVGGEAILVSINLSSGKVEKYRGLSNLGYVRSVEFHDGKIYAGLGPMAKLVEIDPLTGSYKNILPRELSDDSVVYWMRSEGKKLIFSLSPSHRIFSYEPSSEHFNLLMADAVRSPVLYPSKMQAVFRGYGDFFYEFDEAKAKLSRVILSSIPTTGGDINNRILSGFTRNGLYVEYGLKGDLRQTLSLSEAGLDSSGTRPFSISAFGKQVFISERELRIFNPVTYKERYYPLFGEAKAMCVSGKALFSAHYTDAVLWKFPLSDFDLPEVNLTDQKYRLWEIGSNQNRPTSIFCSDEYVLVGTEPDYGKYGGALSVLFNSGERLVLDHLIANHTIFSITADGDEIFVGSAASGGSGAKPLGEPARIVKYNLGERRVIFDVVPGKSNRLIRSLAVIGSNVFAALDDGTLVVIDRMTGKLRAKRKNAKIIQLLRTKDGELVGTTRGSLVKISTSSFTQHIIVRARGPENFVLDSVSGDFYWIEEMKLHSISRDIVFSVNVDPD
ncbi:hypothetical protein [Pseudomonas borbori]|uniref:Uncharacterized protein n=1 Tax=Pseudomonas borbori TaxID=289003 RepID=A0A1I5K4G3_9PSED|nr:hypothetical protein [Pseudomonas borbori]SFO79887.1 hypothetical protein SAMN05216190_10114 [Pseudomonas borbori]